MGADSLLKRPAYDALPGGLRWLAAAGVVALTGLGACNHTPVEGLEKSFTLKVQQNTGDSDPIKIDFLWVVDNSTSMCEEQNSLAQSFNQFVDRIQQAFDIDMRVAVTSVDAQCEPYTGVGDSRVYSAKGAFNTHPATTLAPGCQESQVRSCIDDSDCTNLDCYVRGECDDPDDTDCTCEGGSVGVWTCDWNPQFSPQCLVTPNGSITTECTRECTTDMECQDLFGDPRYICHPSVQGCILPPPTADCPAEVPPVLDNDNLELFPCLATVGVNQQKCLKYEEGLKSALMALDKNGRNAEQARDFLRDDAYLVIIVISDEEDCSVADGRSIGEDRYQNCGLLTTTDTGGPLVPVGHYVNRFKALKTDPGRVIVATISGDSTADDPATQEAERAAYIDAKGQQRTCFHESYICLSESGQADFGSRYMQLAQGFGPNGTFQNICDNPDIGPALDAVAQTIVDVLNRVCLPRPILNHLVVKRVRSDGTEVILTEGTGPDTYAIQLGAEDCAIDGVIMPALTFADPPIPGEQIEIEYQGDPEFE